MSTNPPEPTLEERVAELESNLKEIGTVVYEMMKELREQGNINALPEPICPPICPRS